ncbi:MAG: CAP domain-containing protein [Terriglobia bacterium]
MSSKRILAVTLIIAVLFLFHVPAVSSGLTATPDEKGLLELVNEERVSRGLPILRMDSAMVEIARDHSREMVELNYFDHVSPISGDLLERIGAHGVNDWRVVGENLAAAPTVRTAFVALMESRGHRENILNEEFTHVGIGAVASGPYGKMFTQEFVGKDRVVFAENFKVLPFHGETKVSFALLYPGRVSVTVHDMGGDRVATAAKAELHRAGPIEVRWDGQVRAEAGSGEMYEYRVSFDSGAFKGSMSTVAPVGQGQVVVSRPTFSLVLFLQALFERIL